MKRVALKSAAFSRIDRLESREVSKLRMPKAEPKVRTKKCSVTTCRKPFEPRNVAHKACSVECALALAEQLRAKADRIARRQGLEKLKRRADYLKDVERACNAYIRARDADKPCISCGRTEVSAWHAGHYLSVGARPALRFNELNIHRQCKQCNVDFGGNAIRYRIGLLERVGADIVDWLEGPHDPAKWTVDQLKALKSDFVDRLKALKAMA